MLGLFGPGSVVNVGHHMRPQLSRSRNLWSCEPILLSIAHELAERRVVPDVTRTHLGTETLPERKGEDMSALRRLRIFWILWVATIVLACSSDAGAQTSYKVTDLGREGGEKAAGALSVN